MRIRPATPDDALALATVLIASWRVAYRGQVPQSHLDGLDPEARSVEWRKGIRSTRPPAGTSLLEHDSDGVIGLVHVSPVRDADMDPALVGEVNAIYVSPAHWGTGGGRMLMDAGLRRLADAGYRTAVLWVLESNVRARGFYEALEWVPDGGRKTDDSRGFPLIEVRYRHDGVHAWRHSSSSPGAM